MNEHFKITETVEYHIYSIDGKHSVLVSDSYSDAAAAFNGGDIVYERHIMSSSSEWTNVMNIVEYQWHGTWK